MLSVDNFLKEKQLNKLIRKETAKLRAKNILRTFQLITVTVASIYTFIIVHNLLSSQSVNWKHSIFPVGLICSLWVMYFCVKNFSLTKNRLVANRIFKDLPRIYRWGLYNNQTLQPSVEIVPGYTQGEMRVSLDIYVATSISESFVRRTLSHYQQDYYNFDPVINLICISGTEGNLYRRFRFLRWRGPHHEAYEVYQTFQSLQQQLLLDCQVIFNLEEHLETSSFEY